MKLWVNTLTKRATGLTPPALYTGFKASRLVGTDDLYSYPRAYVLNITSVLGKGIDYILSYMRFSPGVNTSGVYTQPATQLIRRVVLCLGVLVTGFTLCSFSHDAEWTLFQGCPILAVLTTAFFTFRITDLAELLVKKPNINALPEYTTYWYKSQGVFCGQ